MEDRNYYMTQGIDDSGVSEIERFNRIGDYGRIPFSYKYWRFV